MKSFDSIVSVVVPRVTTLVVARVTSGGYLSMNTSWGPNIPILNVPAHVSPTTPRNTSPAAAAIASKKKLRNSDLVIKLWRYLRAAYA